MSIIKLLGSRLTILLLSVIGTLVLGFLIVHAIEQNTKQKLRQEQLIESLEIYRSQAEALSKVAHDTQKSIQILEMQTLKLLEQYDEIAKLNPMPASCVLDSSRLSIINQAISNASKN